MTIDIDALTSAMTSAGAAAFAGSWDAVQDFAGPELHKIAVQIAAIETGGYDQDIAKKLLAMQVESAVDVLIAMAEITALQVQTAINAILKAVAGQVNGALGFVLL